MVGEEDLQEIRNCRILPIIIDLSTYDNEWMAVYARIIGKDHRASVKFWTLMHVPNGQSGTFWSKLIGIFEDSSVDINKLTGWASDGCSSMLAGTRILQERADLTFIVCHCFCHRLDLVVSE